MGTDMNRDEWHDKLTDHQIRELESFAACDRYGAPCREIEVALREIRRHRARGADLDLAAALKLVAGTSDDDLTAALLEAARACNEGEGHRGIGAVLDLIRAECVRRKIPYKYEWQDDEGHVIQLP
jgi:hypothetical protein